MLVICAGTSPLCTGMWSGADLDKNRDGGC